MTDDIIENVSEPDENVRDLLTVLESLPGVYTNSSCGGHREPTDDQLNENEFYVDFCLDDEEPASLASLTLLTYVCQEVSSPDGPTCLITPWYDEVLRFDLHGYDVTPETVADALRAQLTTIQIEHGPSGDVN